MIKRSLLAGFALAAVVALGSLCSATNHPLRPNQRAETFDSVVSAAPAGALGPFDEEGWRIQRLTESLEQSRAAAAKNPLLLADVAYYEAELAASRLRARR